MSTTSDSSFQKQRIAIGLAIGSNPPWTNKKAVCACGAEFQFGCADELEALPGVTGESADYFQTPPCWTCGKVNVLTIRRDEPEGNPS